MAETAAEAAMEIKGGERLDDTGFSGIKVIQGDGFSYGVDSVLLAAWAAGQLGAPAARKLKVGREMRIMDLGTGNGVIPLILSHKIPECSICGVEFRPESVDRAVRSAELNGLHERLEFVEDDVGLLLKNRPEMAGTFDSVVTNPPYFKAGAGMAPPEQWRRSARWETTADLGDFIRCAGGLLKDKGNFYMVHRPFRMADIICEMREAGLEPKTLRLVVPRDSEAPNILLIHGVKNGGPELKVLPSLAVHSGNGYTEELLEIYRT